MNDKIKKINKEPLKSAPCSPDKNFCKLEPTRHTKISKRKCAGCGEIKPKKDMIRIMKTHDTSEIIVMPSSKHFGRSTYLCYNKECIKQAIKKKRLQKTLKKDIPITILNYLESILD